MASSARPGIVSIERCSASRLVVLWPAAAGTDVWIEAVVGMTKLASVAGGAGLDGSIYIDGDQLTAMLDLMLDHNLLTQSFSGTRASAEPPSPSTCGSTN